MRRAPLQPGPPLSSPPGGRALHLLSGARTSAARPQRPGHPQRSRRDRPIPSAAPVAFPDPGPGRGDGGPPILHQGQGYSGLLLQPGEPLAARGSIKNTNGLLRQYFEPSPICTSSTWHPSTPRSQPAAGHRMGARAREAGTSIPTSNAVGRPPHARRNPGSKEQCRSPARRGREDQRDHLLPATAGDPRRSGGCGRDQRRHAHPARAHQLSSPPAPGTMPATPADRSPSSDSHDHATDFTRLRRSLLRWVPSPYEREGQPGQERRAAQKGRESSDVGVGGMKFARELLSGILDFLGCFQDVLHGVDATPVSG